MKRISLLLMNMFCFAIFIYTSISINVLHAFTTEQRPLIMPATFIYIVWALIYFGLLLFIISQCFIFDTVTVTSGYFILTILLTTFSLIVTPHIAPLFLIGALLFLIFLYKRVHRYLLRLNVSDDATNLNYWRALRGVFSVYLSWLCITLILNISTLLKSLNSTSFFGIDELTWASFILIFMSLIATFFTHVYRDHLFSLVFILTYSAIAFGNLTNIPIVLTSCGCILIVSYAIHVSIRETTA